MKKFTKQALYGFIVGAAVLFAACSDLVYPPTNAVISTTPGTGQVRVSIAGEDFAPAASARTIYPTQPTLPALYYVYTFTKDEAEAVGQDLTTVDGTFTLTTGDWNLTVTAYLEAAHTTPVATGSTGAAFTVTGGVSTPVSVTLEPEKSTGTGTLTYTVTYPAGTTLVSLDWKKLGGAGTIDLTSGLTPTTAGGVTTLTGTKTAVDAGYYVITAALTDGNKTAGKKEVVHIYQNLTTEVTGFDFEAGDFTSREPVLINAGNLGQMATLIAAQAAAGGGTSSTDPIIVSIAIDDVSLLSGTSWGGHDPLLKLFDAIPSGKYVAYDLSGCTFGSIPDAGFLAEDYRPNKDYLASITIPDSVTSIGDYAFSYCSGLTSVTIGNGVTSIGERAFQWCGNLTSVTIGNSVASIGNHAFSGCYGLTAVVIDTNYVVTNFKTIFSDRTSLTTVTIGDSVDSISETAFEGCSGLTSVTIGDSVTFIRRAAFNNCSGLTSVTIGNSVTFIGQAAFAGCSGLTSVTIPDSVTSIDSYAFNNCSGLTSVTIGNGVTSIGSNAFAGCSGLTSVTIGDSVTSIGGYAFAGCSSLTSVTIPNSVTSIGYAFQNCSGLTSVIIGNGVTSGNNAFSGCSGLTSVVIDTNYVVTNFKTIFSDRTSLSTVTIGDSVTSIGNQAFAGCSGLTSVTIGNSVTFIGRAAFNNCSGLTAVTIPDSVTSIDSEAFSGCSGLTSITVDSGNTNYKSIDGVLFIKAGTTLVQYPVGKTGATYTIPAGVTSIGSNAFQSSSLTSVTIPDSVTSIGSNAFQSSSLTSVTIPDSVTSIGGYAFQGCSGLTSVTIPDSVTSIGERAFNNCSSLTSVTIPDSVTSIGDYAFYNCSGLTSVTIGNSVTSIGREVFGDCSGLTSITVDSGNTNYKSIDGVLFNKAGTTLVQYPVGKTGAAYTIPAGVTSIGSNAFYNCSSLTSVTIPDSVTSIGGYAFYNCSGLTSVYILRETPTLTTLSGYNVFTNTNASLTIYVPVGVVSSYKTATRWSSYASKIQAGAPPTP